MGKLKKVFKKLDFMFFKYIKCKNELKGITAKYFYDICKNDLKRKDTSFSKSKIKEIHKKGFSVDTWKVFNLNDNNYKKYLSDYQYFKMHPINGRFSHWIDDKLTLKYMFAGHKDLKYVMPEYYIQIDDEGKILPLMDCPQSDKTGIELVIEILKSKTELALKRESGSIGEGFYKLSYSENSFKVNDAVKSEAEFSDFIIQLKNYLITEFIKPNKVFAKFCAKTTNTIRYLSAIHNGEVIMACGFIRFGTEKSEFIDNYNAGGVLCYYDKKGFFHEGNIFNAETGENKKVKMFPDKDLAIEGNLPDFDKLEGIVKTVHRYFPQLKYCGFDFVYTDKNEYRILEINSLTSLDAIQIDKSVFDSDAADFFRSLLK